jgi:hypothetical protein
MAKPKEQQMPQGGQHKPPPPKVEIAPMVDTSLAADVAARLVANRAKLARAAGSEAPQKESGLFKQLKEGLSRPHAQVIGEALHKITPPDQHPTHLHAAMEKQVGHVQTKAGIGRMGVPRRTATGS